MISSGQDKRLGPFWAKLLSAHLFFWPTPFWGWAKDSSRLPMALKKTAGPNSNIGPKPLLLGVLR